ncbi:MAG: phosphate transporter, permease protein PstA/phosphate transporter, permease protein PstC [Chthonomonadaceae bacterium]|nr:phosphate transporter, permease protein PstA/phosphate transporter, permease protein PstC [Chthonomonadaceae bacterium]
MAQTLSGNPSDAPADKDTRSSGDLTGGFGAGLGDWIFRNLTLVFALTTVVFILGIAVTLFLASRANLTHTGFSFFKMTTWDPVPADADKLIGDIYGVLPFVYGTLVTSAIALILAVPIGVGAAIFLAEIAPRWLSTPVSFLIEMLAAVPSIVYGFWALLYLVPLMQLHGEKWLHRVLGHIPFFMPADDSGSGYSYLTAGLILTLMILPFIAAVSRDVLRTVPMAQREAAYGMGATKWEGIKTVVLRYASGGIIGAIMLGLGRAIGETMAVTIVIGSKVNIPKFGDASSFSLFRPGYTMTSILADQYPSPNSPLHIAALTQVALTLFAVTILLNGAARGLVWLTALRAGGTSSEFSITAKTWITSAMRWSVLALVALTLLYQMVHDFSTWKLGGFTGGAFLITAALALLFGFNRYIPGKPFFVKWRQFCNVFALVMCGLAALVASAALLTLFYFVAKEGFSSVNAQFFKMPNLTDPDKGGMLHAIAGTGLFIAMASAIGIPIGVMGGIFLSEFGNNKIGFWVRFATDLLNGVPSIVLGIFAYQMIVVRTQSNFGYAGGFALGIMMIPTVMRTTEELVRLVPQALREASLALGATQVRTIWKIVLPAAKSGIVTGVLLAVARIAGETAPLLMVGCNSSLWHTNPHGQLASLPVQIYVLRDAPTDLALKQSWGVALVLVVMVLSLNIVARFLTRNRMGAPH